jgi:ABC-2 type transport system ATP-binding protein
MLSKTYNPGKNAVNAVRDVNFEVYQGELFGLFGSNGAGKSTLVRMLATLLHPTSGSANVNGYDVVQDEQKVRSFIGFVASDERSFYGRLSSRQNLSFFAALQSVSRSRIPAEVDRVLKLFNLQSMADVPSQSLSTGQKQRLNIARALVHDPPLLFLDEPTKSMDVQTSDYVKTLIKDNLVGTLGKTVVFISHELYEMDAFCDRVAILADGSIRALGTPSALAERLPRRAIYRINIKGDVSCMHAYWEHIEDIEKIETISRGITLTVLDVTLSDETSNAWLSIMQSIHKCGGRMEGYQRVDDSSLRDIVRYFSNAKDIIT